MSTYGCAVRFFERALDLRTKHLEIVSFLTLVVILHRFQHNINKYFNSYYLGFFLTNIYSCPNFKSYIYFSPFVLRPSCFVT